MSDLRTTTSLASDARGLDSLRLQAGKDPKASIRAAAEQFEALFMQQMLKSMRAATPATGMLDNEGSRLGTDLLDAQLTTVKGGRSNGLADLIARQIERNMGITADPTAPPKQANASLTGARQAELRTTPLKVPENGALGFVQQHRATAARVAADSGIPATFMLAQAALETGWGGKEIIGRDGTRANNLFGIKAGSSWKGPTVDVMTTEFMNGQAQKVVQKFRAYASHAESFADYARLINNNPRYAGVKASAGDSKAFAQGLQTAGYATDPAYADKLSRVIDTTRRLQRQST